MDIKIAYLFPGQGSQSVGMGKELSASYPAAKQVFQQADDLLGFPISRLAWDGPEDQLNDTINTQPALLVHSAAALIVLRQLLPQIEPAYTAGHSMGELSALLAAEALDFAHTLALTRRRGELMKLSGEHSPGGMAAILGLDIPTLEKVCAEASLPGEIVQVANDNCPGQVVISGNRAAIGRAVSLAQRAGARRAMPLAVSIAAHSPLMAYIQEDFNRAVQQAPLTVPRLPIVGNVNARPLVDSVMIRADLQAQLTSRVRWTESIQFMLTEGVQTFIEIGNGSVLGGLLKRINSQAYYLSCSSPADLDKILDAIN